MLVATDRRDAKIHPACPRHDIAYSGPPWRIPVRRRMRVASFPSAPRHLPTGAPLVVAQTNEGDFVRQFAGAAAGDDAPRLAWTATGGCRR
jgi:hypothetical protein